MSRDCPGASSVGFDVGDAAPIDIVGNFVTVAAWARADTTATARMIVAKETASQNNGQYCLTIAVGGVLRWRISDNGGTADQVDGATPLTVGTWTHCCGVKDGVTGNSLRVYRNGVQDGVLASTRSIANSANPLRIGDRTVPNNQWDGLLAEAAVWGVALLPNEIAALGKGVSPLFIRRSALRGYWPLHGVLLTSEVDLSGSGIPAAQYGATIPVGIQHAPVGRMAAFAG